MSSLVHIAPQLPPAIDGVGDYCWNLWQHWPEKHPRWTFLVSRGAQDTSVVWREVNVRSFTLTRAGLAAALEETPAETAVLHYVGYGFQPKGIPVWLPGALADWKARNPRRRLVTMFHEMYARSSPLRSPFWVAPFARRIIRQLAAMSDNWVTNCERYFNQLTTEFAAEARRGRVVPIGSNIPVCAPDAPEVEHAKAHGQLRVVFFGLAKTRLWALERHWRLLRALSEAGLLESVLFLGKAEAPEDTRERERFQKLIGKVAFKTRFDVSATDVSRHLAQQDLGFIANEPDVLTKSGVFAALASHGLVPVLSTRNGAGVPEFARGAVLGNDDSEADVQRVTASLRQRADLERVREAVMRLAAEQLAWSRITRAFADAVEQVNAAAVAHAKSSDTTLGTVFTGADSTRFPGARLGV
jgi:hypothetical protein